MRSSPSIVPPWADHDIYLVLDEFGWLGCAWRETNGGSVDRETLIRALVEGEFGKPIPSWPSTPPKAGPVT